MTSGHSSGDLHWNKLLGPLWLVVMISACQQSDPDPPQDDSAEFASRRQAMVEDQLRAHGIEDERVLQAMTSVPRHQFVPAEYRGAAYADGPLPIGHDQTISQPYIVALMTQLLNLKPPSKVLDIGTGSGYQAAVLGELCQEVYSIEIVEPLAEQATRRLRDMGYTNILVRSGDGYAGWPEHAPFDGIVVAAAPDHVPPALVEQLAPGARLVIPIGEQAQKLLVIEKLDDGSTKRTEVIPVAFVPMTGEALKKK